MRPSTVLILLSILSPTTSSPLTINARSSSSSSSSSSSLESSPGPHNFSPAPIFSSPKPNNVESTPGPHTFSPAPIGRKVRSTSLESTPGTHEFAPAPVWGSPRRKGPLESRSSMESTPGTHKLAPAPVWGSSRRKGPLEERANALESTPGTHKFKPAPVWGIHRGKGEGAGRRLVSRQSPHGIGSPRVGGAAAGGGGDGGDGSAGWREGGQAGNGPQSMPHGMVVGGIVGNRRFGKTIATPLSNITLTCNVGGTRTSLFITLLPASFPSPLPSNPSSSTSPNTLTSEAFNTTLSALTAYISDIIAAGLDQPLADIFQDPFLYTVHKGAVLHAKSIEGDELTWGVLGSAVRGLGECLGGRFGVGVERVEWMVKDSNWGVVGEGDVGFEEV